MAVTYLGSGWSGRTSTKYVPFGPSFLSTCLVGLSVCPTSGPPVKSYLMRGVNSLGVYCYWEASFVDSSGVAYHGANLPLSKIRIFKSY
jgi:hypothetical protein